MRCVFNCRIGKCRRSEGFKVKQECGFQLLPTVWSSTVFRSEWLSCLFFFGSCLLLTLYAALCLLAARCRQVFSSRRWTTLKFKVILRLLPSPDSVCHSAGLVAIALAVPGVLQAFGCPLVPPQSHGPVGEHRDALGNPPAGLAGEQCERETGMTCQMSSLTSGEKAEGGEARLGGRQRTAEHN